MNRTVLVFKITLILLFLLGCSIFIYIYLSKKVHISVKLWPFNISITKQSPSKPSFNIVNAGVIILTDESGSRLYTHGLVVDIKDTSFKYDITVKSGKDSNTVFLNKSKPVRIFYAPNNITLATAISPASEGYNNLRLEKNMNISVYESKDYYSVTIIQ